MSEFVHFHCHNEYSLLDGYGTAEQYVAEASKLRLTSLGCTNHGNVDGCIKFQNACKEGGIIPIIGCELYVVKDLVCTEKKEKRYHALALAKNETGWTNLLKMLTLANTEGFHYKPRVSPEVMLNYSEGLVVCSACSSSFIRADWGENLLLGLKERLDKDLYLEVMPHLMKDQCDTNLLAVALSRKHDIPLCASNDCHYPTAVGAEYQEVLLAIQSRTVWNDPKRWKFDTNTLYLKNNRQMFKDFISQKCLGKDDILQAFEGGQEIASKCKFLIPKLPVNLPKVVGHETEDETELLSSLLKIGFKQRILSHPKRSKNRSVYQARLDEEFKSICELGFQKYFAIVWELINWCKSNGIMVGPGRGSVGGSLLAYLLYITDVDPIEHKLLFSRFISPARIDLPDIDMDFEDRKRHLVRKHLEDSYGKNNIAGLSTFSTMKGRGAIRDVSRVFSVPRKDVDAASKSIVVRSGGDNRCLIGDTKIYTTQGKRKIKELKCGDKVASIQGEKIERRTVSAVWKNGRTEVFELVLSSGKKILCSSKHRFWTKTGWKILSKLSLKDEIQTCDEEDVYCFCQNCGNLIYKDRKEGKKFCCLSCTTTYKNLNHNPMENQETVNKMRCTKKGKRCKWHDNPVKMAAFKIKQRKHLLENNPMWDPKVVDKLRASLRRVMGGVNRRPERVQRQRDYMNDRLDKDPQSHPLRILAKRERKGVARISYFQKILSDKIKELVDASKVEDEFPVKRAIDGVFNRKGWMYLDVAIPSLKIDFEYDGGMHSTPEAKGKDKARDALLKSLGWRVIRFSKRDLLDRTYIDIIKEVCCDKV